MRIELQDAKSGKQETIKDNPAMGKGKQKIEMKMLEKPERRMVTFSKRRKGLFKKAQELHSLTGATSAVLTFSPAGRPFAHGDPSFDSTIDCYLRSLEPNYQEENQCKAEAIRAWLEGIRVDENYNVEELIVVKNLLEDMKSKMSKKDEVEFFPSLLA